MAKRERTQLSTKHRIVIKINTKVPLVEQEMLVIQEHLTSPRLFCWFVLLNFSFLCNILRIIVCHIQRLFFILRIYLRSTLKKKCLTLKVRFVFTSIYHDCFNLRISML
jgi:hypothetical protein